MTWPASQRLIHAAAAGPSMTSALLAVLGLALAACGVTGPDTTIDPARTQVTVSHPLLLPGDTVAVSLRAFNAAGQPLPAPGATVAFFARGGSSVGTFLPVVHTLDGSYSAKFVGETAGTALTITAQINGEAISSAPPTLQVVAFTRIVAAGTTLPFKTQTAGFTCGIITNGDMYCWGISWHGIRGNGTPGSWLPGPEPALVGGHHQWVEVAAGDYFVCAIAADGVLYCWGEEGVGQLGNGLSGSPPDVTVPTPVSGNYTFRAVSVGPSSGPCALTARNAALCWGAGAMGRVGDGGDTLSAVPVAVSGGLTFDALSASDGGACGMAGGTAYCWGGWPLLGLNGSAPDVCAVGGSTLPCAKAPVAVSGGHAFRAIVAVNTSVACAVATDNQTYCWGSGIIGDGTWGVAGAPTAVSGGLSFVSLVAGDGYFCGTVADGAAYCWGVNYHGRLGDGTTTDALVPTAVSGSHAFVQLSGGGIHTCGVATDGNAYCWGGNDRAELGDRTEWPSLTPVRVRLFSP